MHAQCRPKLFPVWGAIVPIRRAVTSLLTSFLDSHREGTAMANVTLEEAPPPSKDKCPRNDENIEQESEAPQKCGMLTTINNCGG